MALAHVNVRQLVPAGDLDVHSIMTRLLVIFVILIVFSGLVVSCFVPEDTIQPDCKTILALFPESITGEYTIDPDGEGGEEPFVTVCDMDTDGGGWTLVGIVSYWDDDSWTDYSVWSDDSTFGDLETANDYKNPGWSTIAFDQFMMKADGYEGLKVSDTEFGRDSLASLFGSAELVSVTGTESDWEYNVGDLDLTNDAYFFAEIQNPPETDLVNTSERNDCILATAYDGYFGDDQVEGFGCGPGDGVTACDNNSCGDTSAEDETWFYVR